MLGAASRRFVFVHGPKSDSWYWHRVLPYVTEAGFDAVAVDLPVDQDLSLADYADVVAAAVAGHPHPTLVTHSLAAFVAPLVVGRVDVDRLVLVSPMVPQPGGRAADWMAQTGQRAAARQFAVEQGRDPDAPFTLEEFYLHDLPLPVVQQFRHHARAQSLRPFEEPWPLAAWPRVPTECVVGRHDRLYPYEFQCRVIAERLGLEPVAIDGGHLCALSSPAELSRVLLAMPSPARSLADLRARSGTS